MEKLTQFVSKSFENNNNYGNRPKADRSPMSETDAKEESIEVVKEEKVTVKTDVPVAKNWLISTSPKPQNASYGIDLRITTNGYSVYPPSPQRAPSEPAKYPEISPGKADKPPNEKDSVKWYENGNGKVCCCPPSSGTSHVHEQDDSTDSNMDNMAHAAKISQQTTPHYEDKNNSKKRSQNYEINSRKEFSRFPSLNCQNGLFS